MIIETNIRDLLELMGHPAFCVLDGTVTEANPAAQNLGISPGMSASALIHSGDAQYRAFTEGVLFLTIQVGGQIRPARISKLSGIDLFSLEQDEGDPRLQAFSLAAQEFRMPLSQVMNACDRLMTGLGEVLPQEDAAQFGRMNQGLYQLLRLVSNMSDAQTAGVSRMEIRDLTALVQEIMDHAEPLCRSTGITLRFVNHPVSIYSLADSQKLERAIYNLLSNAMKHTPAGGAITVQFTKHGNTVHLTVSNPNSEAQTPLSADAYTRYRREPGTGSVRDGLGLGISLVRSVAAAHHGTLLFTPSGDPMQAVLTLPIRQDSSALRSPTLLVDYAGERDHGLVELSDLLPPELYSSK